MLVLAHDARCGSVRESSLCNAVQSDAIEEVLDMHWWFGYQQHSQTARDTMSATGVGNQDKYCEPDTKHTTPHTSTAIEPLHCTSLVSGYLHVEFNMLSRAGDQVKQRTLRDLVSARITNVSAHLFADGSIKDKLISYPAVHLLLLICI